MSIHDEVNLIIFRIPNELEDKEYDWDDGFRLVEMPYLGRKLSNTGTIFLPGLDDVSFRSIAFDCVVLARTTATGANELQRRQFIPANKTQPLTVCELEFHEMSKLVDRLVAEYDIDRLKDDTCCKI